MKAILILRTGGLGFINVGAHVADGAGPDLDMQGKAEDDRESGEYIEDDAEGSVEDKWDS